MDANRAFRLPVRKWTRLIQKHLEAACRKLDAPEVSRICAYTNQAGLLYVCAGESAFAERICNLQLHWLARLKASHDASLICTNAVQPWINLGRLFRQRGETERALAQFEAVLPRGSVVSFGAFAAPAVSVTEHVELLYALDSAKVYSSARRHADTLAFVDRARQRLHSPAAQLALAETEVQAATALGIFRRAADGLKSEAWNLDWHSIVANAFYRCVVGHAIGREPAGCVLSKLADHAIAECGANVPDHRSIRYALELARLMAAVPASAGEATLAEAGYDAALRCEDVPLQAQFVLLLAGTDAATARVQERVAEIYSHSDHLTYGKRCGVRVILHPETIEVLKDLERMIVEILHV